MPSAGRPIAANARAAAALLLCLLAAGACGGAAAPHTPVASGAGGAGIGAGAGSAGADRAGRAGAAGASDAGAPTSGRGAAGASGAGAGGAGQGMDAALAGDGGTDGAAPGPDGAAPDAGPTGTPYVYVSGYGPDIVQFSLDLTSGELAELRRASGGSSPSYLAFAPDGRALYAINEGGGSSQVIAFAIAPGTGALTEINRAATMGEGSPHLAVHPSGDYVAVAHYGSGHVSILQVREDRGVMAATEVERGPNDDCRKAHQAVFDASGRFLLVPCLESNYVLQFRFDGGQLTYNTPPTAAVAGGPRHLALSPDQRHAYVLSELESTITSFDFDSAAGTLSNPETIPSHDGTKGASAHIAVHPSGDFVYASNRSENSLGLFTIDGDGRPAPVAFVRDMVSTPRDFTIDPTGALLISANQNGAENLLVFRIDQAAGTLTRLRTVAVGGRPSFVGVIFVE